jgi:hypothetical protein
MNNNLHHVLQACLQEMQDGAQLEAILERYPADLAERLRPMLLAALDARRMAVSGPSKEAFWRNRAKLIHAAARTREEERKRFGLRLAMQRWVTVLVLSALFFFSGTSLVRASSAALPGDSLYRVKRSWENFMLAFTFDSGDREILEVEHENERLEELNELFASGRSAMVDFAGIITRESGAGWWISNILVIVPDGIVPSGQPIQVGSAVRVYGRTGGNGIVLAERIESLPAGAALPEIEEHEVTVQSGIESPAPGAETEVASGETTESASPKATPMIESLTGKLTSIQGVVWKIDNVLVNVRNAEIKGVPVVGARARATGYYGTDGVFVARRIEIVNPEPEVNDNSSPNDHENDSSQNVNEHANENDHDNENDDEHESENHEEEHQEYEENNNND